MFKSMRENLGIRVLSVLASILLWLYVSADRRPSYARTVNADVTKIGSPPPDVIVRIRPSTVPIEVNGPRSEVNSLDDNAVKAEVDIHNARVGMSQLRVSRYRKPAEATGIDVTGQEFVSVDVMAKIRKQMAIKPMFNTEAGPASRYGAPRVRPEWALVTGAADDVKRVAQLVVSVDAAGQPVSADLPIQAQDRDGVEVTGLEINPSTAHVEAALEQPPATRTLVVNVVYHGRPGPGYALTEVVADPATVVVAGKAEQIQALSNISTQDLNIDGIVGETTRPAMLRAPDGVSVVGGHPGVRVTFRVAPVAKPTGPGGT